jgi:hypothetical protein
VKPESFSWYHPDDPICVPNIRPNFTSILKIFALLFDWNVLGLMNLDIGFVYWRLLVRSDPAWAFPIRTDCVTIFLDVVANGGPVRWNWHITPDLCLAWPPPGCTIQYIQVSRVGKFTLLAVVMPGKLCILNYLGKIYWSIQVQGILRINFVLIFPGDQDEIQNHFLNSCSYWTRHQAIEYDTNPIIQYLLTWPLGFRHKSIEQEISISLASLLSTQWSYNISLI